MSISDFIMLFAIFQCKHFICDFSFPLPPCIPAEVDSGFFGCLIHSAVHCLGTSVLLLLTGISLPLSVLIGVIDGILHYVIDWSKIKINISHKLGPSSTEFWSLIGLDQLLHQLTYVVLLYIIYIQ